MRRCELVILRVGDLGARPEPAGGFSGSGIAYAIGVLQ
jgi:hypothetical protein